jgi:hypothetical protein
MNFSYCESVTASSTSAWHIRQLTDRDKKLGGGADTAALCGKTVSWDLNADVSHNDRTCPKCWEAYQNMPKEPKSKKPFSGISLVWTWYSVWRNR